MARIKGGLNAKSYKYGKIFFMFFTLVASVMVALRRFLFLFWDFLVKEEERWQELKMTKLENTEEEN